MRFDLSDLTPVMETIQFQKTDFFDALTDAISKCRSQGAMNAQDFFDSKAVKELEKIVKEFTEIKIKLVDGAPAIYIPQIDRNHIFVKEWMRDLAFDITELEYDPSSQMREALNKLKKESALGTVDIRTGKISGVYREIVCVMQMPYIDLSTDQSKLTEKELAAIMLHEVGHAYTTYEFVSRAITTNQVLHAMITTLDKTITLEQRSAVFIQCADVLDMSNETVTEAMKVKDKTTLAAIAVNAAKQKCISELGNDVYDSVDCEQLADQFAMRMGVGSNLASGLDKITMGFQREHPIAFFLVTAISILLVLSMIVFTFGVLLFALLSSVDRRSVYDRPRSRFTRMRLQIVERLKDKSIPAQSRKELLEQHDNILKIEKVYTDNDLILEKMALFFSSTLREQKRVELLQKDLEIIAGNDLFTKSAKLGSIWQ